MKPLAIFLLALAALAGCRREDVRTMTVSFTELAPAEKSAGEAALKRFAGIRKEANAWDFEKKSLTVTYDSMQLAEANIRYALAEKGLKVAFPEKTDSRAGH